MSGPRPPASSVMHKSYTWKLKAGGTEHGEAVSRRLSALFALYQTYPDLRDGRGGKPRKIPGKDSQIHRSACPAKKHH